MSAQSFAIKAKRTSKPARRSSGSSSSAKHLAQPVIKPTRKLPIQAKLTIGQPNDKYEQEADKIADQVMRMSDADVAQRVETGTVQPMHIQRLFPECKQETAQRQPENEEEEELQAKEIPGQIPTLAPNLESRINSLKGGGQPLDSATRSFFEPRFGHDFSHVRVHTDSSSADTAKSINARAFTLGNHVVMGTGEYQPNIQSGQRLLGHELTHMIQQNSLANNLIQRQNDSSEQNGVEFDPRREILSLVAFDRRYPEVLRTFNSLDAAIDELNADVEAYGSFQFGERYARAYNQWNQANELLEQYWSIARVMVAVRRAGQILVVINSIRRAQINSAHPGFGPTESLLTRPHRRALNARDRAMHALSNRPETQRVHEAVAEEIEQSREAARQHQEQQQRSIPQVINGIRAYARNNYPAITDDRNNLIYALGMARLLHDDLGTDSEQYVALFSRLESETPELYNLILFNGSTISYLDNMGVVGLASYVYREADRNARHELLGSWNYDPATGAEQDSATWLLLLDIIIGLVPYVGQAADARDISGYIYRLGKYPQQRESGMTWIGLVGSIIGLVPAAGDGAKSLLSAIRRATTEVPVGRLSDDIVSRILRYVDSGTLQKILDASDTFTHTVTLRWPIIQGSALNKWDRIIDAMGPLLTRFSDLTQAELDLLRRTARTHLPEALQQAGRWLGQLVRSLWVTTRLSANLTAEDIIETIRLYRETWRLTGQAAHELWSPTARFLAHLPPPERLYVQHRLLSLARGESDEVLQAVQRLVDDVGQESVGRGATQTASESTPIFPSPLSSERPSEVPTEAAPTIPAPVSPYELDPAHAPTRLPPPPRLPAEHAPTIPAPRSSSEFDLAHAPTRLPPPPRLPAEHAPTIPAPRSSSEFDLAHAPTRLPPPPRLPAEHAPTIPAPRSSSEFDLAHAPTRLPPPRLPAEHAPTIPASVSPSEFDPAHAPRLPRDHTVAFPPAQTEVMPTQPIGRDFHAPDVSLEGYVRPMSVQQRTAMQNLSGGIPAHNYNGRSETGRAFYRLEWESYRGEGDPPPNGFIVFDAHGRAIRVFSFWARGIFGN